MAPKISAELPPRSISTRSTNKEKHPGNLIPVQKRRTSEQVAADHAAAQVKKDEQQKKQKAALTAVADLEDHMRREDVQRNVTANHPPPAKLVKAPSTAHRSKPPSLSASVPWAAGVTKKTGMLL